MNTLIKVVFLFNFFSLSTDNLSLEKTCYPFRWFGHEIFHLVNSKEPRKHHLKLFNLILFNGTECGTEWKSINEFNGDSLTWKSKKFIQKFENFYSCTVLGQVYTDFGWKSFLNLQNDFLERNQNIDGDRGRKISESDNATVTLAGGIQADFLEIFESKFKIKFKFMIRRKVNHDEIPTDEFQLRLSANNGRKEDIFAFQISYPLLIIRRSYIVTEGPSYTPMEKLYLPFDLVTWILIISTLLIGYLTILIVYQLPRDIQKFVFGAQIQSPSLNMTEIIFGIGLVAVPDRNFARFLFMNFILFMLVIRTAYQGKMFDFITTDVRKESPNTLEELLNNSQYLILKTESDPSMYQNG